MLAQKVIAGSIAVTGAAQVALPLICPINDRPARAVIALVYLVCGIAGFPVCRWDNRERDRERASAVRRHPSVRAPSPLAPGLQMAPDPPDCVPSECPGRQSRWGRAERH